MVSKQLTILPWYDFDCCGNSKRNSRAAMIKKAHPVSGKNKAPLSPLNQFNKTHNKANHIKTCVLTSAESHCELKVV